MKIQSLLFSSLATCLLSSAALAEQSQLIHSVQSQSYDVVVLGDIEGMKSRLTSFIEKSGVFARDLNGHYIQDADGAYELLPGKAFTFMGDIEDRGDSGRELMEFAIKLKKKYPDRVSLTIGNRDLRKLILITELTDEALLKVDAAFDKFLSKDLGLDPVLHHMGRDLKVVYLMWGTRMRLAELQKTNVQAGLREVVDSYNHDMKPEGLIGQYLQLAQFGFVDDSTGTISVHGALRDANFLKIPWLPFQQWTDVRKWITDLNQTGHALIVKALNGDHQSGQILADYARNIQESVVGARLEDEHGVPELPEPEVIATLLEQNIRRLVIGHTPAGEYPALIRGRGFEVLMTDLSFNQSKISQLIHMQGDELHVTTSTPGESDVTINLRYHDTSVLGTVASGHLIVGESGGDYVLYRIGPKFSRVYKRVPKSQIHKYVHPTCAELFSQI